MTIKNVKKIPTTYRAVQWTGEEEDEIPEVMRESDGYSYAYNDMPESAHLHLYNKKGVGSDHYLRRNDWIVVSSTGKVEILSDDAYAEKYADADAEGGL